MPYVPNSAIESFFFSSLLQKESEYDQDITQSHTADQPMAPRGRAIEH